MNIRYNQKMGCTKIEFSAQSNHSLKPIEQSTRTLALEILAAST
jgi:hypothetical protein